MVHFSLWFILRIPRAPVPPRCPGGEQRERLRLGVLSSLERRTTHPGRLQLWQCLGECVSRAAAGVVGLVSCWRADMIFLRLGVVRLIFVKGCWLLILMGDGSWLMVV